MPSPLGHFPASLTLCTPIDSGEMDENLLIELLNDIAGSGQAQKTQEVYFSSDGQPTDRFLEALKMDLKQLDFPVKSDEDAMQSGLPVRPARTRTRLFPEEAASMEILRSSSPYQDTYASRVRSSSPKPRTKRREGKEAKKKKKPPAPPAPTEEHCKRCLERSRTTPIALPSIDQSDLLLEAESRIRSLELRLQGQLACIKSLEAQSAAQGEQLVVAQRTIVSLQSRQRAEGQRVRESVEDAQVDHRMLDLVDQLKVSPLPLSSQPALRRLRGYLAN